MLGLVAYMAERRVKEMGVRKVLGASAGKIVQLLSAEFLYLIGIAFVIASPIAYLAMERWLEGYAYRIDISWKDFGLAGLITIVISLSTVAYHSLRTALSNPVEALRHE
jgi:putative ABC transport system permease protein